MSQSANRLNISETELFEYIRNQSKTTEKRPAGFGITTAEYAKASERAFSTSRRILGELVKSGKLKSKQMIERGHIVTVYFK
jgi:hypothetical protein